MRTTTLDKLRERLQHRAQLLIGQPLTKHEHLKIVPLPPASEDEYGVRPVVVWLGPPKEEAGGKEKAGGKSSAHQCDNSTVRQRRWTGYYTSSWSQGQW